MLLKWKDMALGRSFFLWASRSAKLRESLPRYRFVRKSVSRFMPGNDITDALNAAQNLWAHKIPTVVTHLGENVGSEKETEEVTEHYLNVLQQIHSRQLDAHISLKLTELGLDQQTGICFANLKVLLEKAKSFQNFVWIDMEGSSYTQQTLDLYTQARSLYENVGVCLQSYLYRTMNDLEQLLALHPAIRLVKGAYAEPPDIAFPKKSDNNENYFKLAQKLLEAIEKQQVRAGFATHDQLLVDRIIKEAQGRGIANNSYEIQMLYGIRTRDQLRLAEQGYRVRVLISYGDYWFPWYMRRLAERPANVLFVLRNMFS